MAGCWVCLENGLLPPQEARVTPPPAPQTVFRFRPGRVCSVTYLCSPSFTPRFSMSVTAVCPALLVSRPNTVLD